ncbi:hypothetical protein MHBO_000684 [Bonamia ostreae]|uniref:Uncharacterized protein n=1 Tax=Bonamia ostreae TaxID=126728 RepID=A0ABV2AH04_9EUKA
MIDKPIFASNISINSLLVYVIPNKDLSQNSQFQTKVDESLRTLSNISSEKTENFDFDFKIFIDEVHFGVLNVNNHSVLPISKEEKFGKFKEKKTSLSAKDIFVFIAENELETKNSDLVKIKCIFSTLQNNQQSLENQENCGNSDISLEKPLFFWNKENANFLNLKIFKRTPLLQPSTKSVKDNVFGDLKIKKMSICFDILDVVERFKMLSGNKFNYRKMKNFIVYFKNGDLEEKFSSKENEFVFRFLLEDLEFVVYNKMKKFAEIQLNNLKFSNQKNLLISSRNRKLITPFLNLDKFGQISRELNFDQIKLSFKQNCLKLSKTVFGHYSDEENLVLAFFNENFDVKMAECFSADDSVVFMKEKMEKLNFTPEKILETFKESDYVKNGIENLIRFLNEKENWNLGKFTNLLKFGQNAFSEKILKFFKQNFKQISENVNLTKPKILSKNKQFLIFENKNLAVQTKLGKLNGCFRSENNLIFYDRSNDYSRFRCSSNKMNLKTPKSNFEKQFFLLKMNKNGENFENNFDLSFSYQPDSFLHSINLLKEQIQIQSNFVSDKNKPAKFDEKALKTAEEKVFGQEIESVLELERKINELKEQILMKDIVIKNYERQLENAFEELNNNIRNKNNNSFNIF